MKLPRVKLLGLKVRRDVIIADNGFEYVKECMPEACTVLGVPMRGEFWYLNARVAFWAVIFLVKRKNAKLGLRGVYIAAVAKTARTRVIATMIDNNNWDRGLADVLDARVICIGNGVRHPNQIWRKCFDCYFAINSTIHNPDLSFEVFAREFYAVGHLKMGLYLERKRRVLQPDVISEQPNRVIWISQYRWHMYDSPASERDELGKQQRSMERIGAEYTARFAQSQGMQCRITMASHRKKQGRDEEKTYFQSAADTGAVLCDHKDDEWGAYREIDGTGFVVGMYSTLLLEAVSIGKRVVFFMPKEFPVVFKFVEECLPLNRLEDLAVFDCSYDTFFAKCSYIRSMSEHLYSSVLRGIQEELAPFDKGYMPQDAIRDYIRSQAFCRVVYRDCDVEKARAKR